MMAPTTRNLLIRRPRNTPATRLDFRTSGILSALLILVFIGTPQAHEGRLRVIVDTDMALDDARALVLLAASNTDILAIVTSDGSCSPAVGAENAARLLRAAGLDPVPIGMGRTSAQAAPPWRPMAEAMGWSGLPLSQDISQRREAQALLADVLSNGGTQVAYLCLGPLTNLADFIQSRPGLAKARIRAIHYYGGPPGDSGNSWNTQRDTAAARIVFRSGIPLYAVQIADSVSLRFDAGLSEQVAACTTACCRLITRLHQDHRVREMVERGHSRCWDESVVLALLYPDLMTFTPASELDAVYCATRWMRTRAADAYVSILMNDQERHAMSNLVALRPAAFEMQSLQDDVAAIAEQTIGRYGHEEWVAVILTNEFHRHLGIYSIVGAKMGIRARELLGARLDEIKVVSRAGSAPPLSCLNDGLQVATGASLGHGTITVTESDFEPSATFVYHDREVSLALRAEMAAQIRGDIEALRKQVGDLTPQYRMEVRRLALRYWRDLDRRSIFVSVPD